MAKFMTKTRNRYNEYLDDIRFSPAKNGNMREVQLLKAFIECVQLSKTQYLNPEGNLYPKVREDIKAGLKKYSVKSVNEVDAALTSIFNGVRSICEAYKENEYIPAVFENGFCVLSDRFYDDVCNGKINKYWYVNAIMCMSYDFKKFI